jgi:hypothetical protein
VRTLIGSLELRQKDLQPAHQLARLLAVLGQWKPWIFWFRIIHGHYVSGKRSLKKKYARKNESMNE